MRLRSGVSFRARIVRTLGALTLATLVAVPLSAAAAVPARDHAVAADAHPTVVTIGDSIVKGRWLLPAQAWPALVAKENGWRLTNLACNSAGFVHVGRLDDCGTDFGRIIPRAVALHPQVVIIEGSRNDRFEQPAALAAATTADIAELHRDLPRAEIIGLSTIWNNQPLTPPTILASSADVRRALAAVGGRFIDIGFPLRGHAEWMLRDDIHPTARGQRAIADAVEAAFARDHVSLGVSR